jgi:pimeloyl-ACP methyl ester carboxylesterase
MLSGALAAMNLQQGDFNCNSLGNSAEIDFCAVDFCSSCPLFGSCTQPSGSCPYGGTLPQWGSFSSFLDEGTALQTMVANLLNATGASQTTLVAHSMGGLASRAYLELHGGGSSVNRLITFGTPNLGSPYASMATDPILSDSLIGFFATIFGLSPDSPAVQSMDPDSPELNNLNVASSGALPHLPTTSYVSIIGKASVLESTGALVAWNALLAAFCDPLDPDLPVCIDLAARTPDMDVFFFDSDLVVSTDSQDLVNAIPAASPCIDVVPGITHLGESSDAAEFLTILGLRGSKPCP